MRSNKNYQLSLYENYCDSSITGPFRLLMTQQIFETGAVELEKKKKKKKKTR